MGVAYNPRVVTDGLVLALDAGNTKSYPVKNFVSSKIYSVFNGSLRSANYTVQYSDDNTNWTTAFSGVSSNNTSCGIQQNTGSGDGSYGFHRYWRYVEGSAVTLHHPRVSRIILTDVNGVDYNLVVYTSDNCSDSGTYIVGTVSLDFGGTTWTDLSGNGKNATAQNGVGYTALNRGGLTFDGIDDHFTISQTETSSQFTYEAFLMPTNVSKDQMYAGVTGNAFYLRITGSKAFLSLTAGGLQRSLTHDTTLQNNQVYHIVSIYNGVQLKIYVNNVLTSGAVINAAMTVWGADRIGRWRDADQRSFVGNIYCLRAYNRELTAAEIQQNFNATRARYGI